MSGLLLALVATTAIAAPSPAAHNAPIHTKAERAKIHQRYDFCNTWKCVKRADKKQRERLWKYYKTHEIMPSCTWIGESGHGFYMRSSRYDTHNGNWHGPPPKRNGDAYGKYQMMYSTYHGYARYHDWSKLDQEIAAHRLYHAKGLGPWQAC